MKKLLLPIILLILNTTKIIAQNNYCNDISKYLDNGHINFQTPMPALYRNIDHDFQLLKIISQKDSTSKMYLYISTSVDFANYNARGIKIDFVDGTSLTYNDMPLNCEYSVAHKHYVISTKILLDKIEFENFKLKKLKSYVIAGQTMGNYIGNFKNKFIAYANCMENFK